MRFIPFLMAFLSSSFVAGLGLNEIENEIRNLQNDDAVVNFVVANRQAVEDNLSKLDDSTRRKVEDTLVRVARTTSTLPTPTSTQVPGSDDSVSSASTDTDIPLPVYIMLIFTMNFLL